MSYTRDWLNTTPINHSKFKSIPQSVREFKVDVEERLQNFMYGFTSGDTAEGLKSAPFVVQTTAPSTVADKFIVHGSDVDSVCELWGADESGNRTQLTSGGALGSNDTNLKSNTLDCDGAADFASSVNVAGEIGGSKRVIVWHVLDLSVAQNVSARFELPFAGEFVEARAYCKTAPVGADFIIDVNLDGTTIWATQGNRPTIADGSNQSSDQTSFDTTTFTDGQVLTLDIDQVGSTTAGSYLTVELEIKSTV